MLAEAIENRLFAEIPIGETAQFTQTTIALRESTHMTLG